MNNPEQTVFIIDDDAAVRDSLSLLIESEGYAIKAYASAEEFLTAQGPGIQGCAIIDLRMPGMEGIRLQEEMLRRQIVISIIFLTGYGDIPTSVKAIKAGAFDFLTKPVAGSELLPRIASALAEARRNSTAASRLASLTAREREVLKLAAEGMPNKEIAQRLGISFRTVEIHRGRAMHKTGASSIVDLANIAREAGIKEP